MKPAAPSANMARAAFDSPSPRGPTAVSSTASPRNNVAARTTTLSQKRHEARPAAQVFRSGQAGPLPGRNRTGITTGPSGRQQGHARNGARHSSPTRQKPAPPHRPARGPGRAAPGAPLGRPETPNMLSLQNTSFVTMDTKYVSPRPPCWAEKPWTRSSSEGGGAASPPCEPGDLTPLRGGGGGRLDGPGMRPPRNPRASQIFPRKRIFPRHPGSRRPPPGDIRMTMYKGKQKVVRGNNVYPWLFSHSVIQPKNTPFRKKHPLYI